MNDLISRDELIFNMKDTKSNAMTMFQFPKNQINVAEAVADAMINNAKNSSTVDAMPVVHGYWETNDYGTLICSKCKIRSAMSRNFYGFQYKSKFCPNCGTKMDERKDGDNDADKSFMKEDGELISDLSDE